MSENHQNLSTPIYNYLKDALLTGEYLPGEQITESSCAKKFRTSRTPVREAFQKLSEDGLIFVNPNKSVEAASYDQKTIIQLGTVRLQLDLLSAKLALHFGSNSDFLKMKDIAIQCYDAETRGEHTKAISLDADFHIALAKTSQNLFLYDIQSSIWLRTQYMLAHDETSNKGYLERIKLHFEIVESIMARDEDATLAKIKEHILARYDLADDLPPGFIDKL